MNQGVADVQLVCCSISKVMIQVICRDSPVNSVTIKGGIEITVCSCPLISRQGLYLKLTLPADVDILAESDNPTHYADGFHCNARSPLQGYAMPFLHSVSA